MSLLQALDKDTIADLDVLDHLFLDVTDTIERRKRIVTSVTYLETILTLRITKAERASVNAIKQQLSEILSTLPKSYPQDPTLAHCIVKLVRDKTPKEVFAPVLSAARQRARTEFPDGGPDNVTRCLAVEIRSRTTPGEYSSLLEDARDYMRGQEDRTATIRAMFV